MTELEAATMHVVVKEARRNGDVVPTCKKLAMLLHPERLKNNKVPPGLARLVNQRLLRLQQNHRFLHKNQRHGGPTKAWHLDPRNLLTEPEPAAYIVLLIDVCAPPHYKTSKTQFHDLLVSEYSPTFDVDHAYKLAAQTGYLETLATDEIRPGERAYAQVRYLHLLAKEQLK
jgi:hypothetical protein